MSHGNWASEQQVCRISIKSNYCYKTSEFLDIATTKWIRHRHLATNEQKSTFMTVKPIHKMMETCCCLHKMQTEILIESFYVCSFIVLCFQSIIFTECFRSLLYVSHFYFYFHPHNKYMYIHWEIYCANVNI